MKIKLEEIKRDVIPKAVIYGFLSANAASLIIGGLFGAAVGAYSVSQFKAGLDVAGGDISKFNQEAFLNNAVEPLQILAPAFSIVLCVIAGILGGYIAGRKAYSVERINAAAVGLLLILSQILMYLLFPARDTGDMPKEIVARMRNIGHALSVLNALATLPLSLWGGSIAAKKNVAESSEQSSEM